MKTTITRHKNVICPLCQGNGTITKFVEQQATTTTISIQRERIIHQCKACEGKGLIIQVEVEETEDMLTIKMPFTQPIEPLQPWTHPHITWNTPTKFPFDVFCKTNSSSDIK